MLQVLFEFEAHLLQNAARLVPVNLLPTFGRRQFASNLEQQVEPHRFNCQGSACLSTARFFKWLITFPLIQAYGKAVPEGRGFRPINPGKINGC
ncbi:MAG: hypothetical protein U7123_24065 [Potamolinea sp.]